MELSVRPATLADAPTIAQVHVDAWRVGYNGLLPDEVLAGLDKSARQHMWAAFAADPAPRSVLLVTEVSGAIRGFVHIGPTRDLDDDPSLTGEVYAIYAAPSGWNTGVGRALITRALTEFDGFGYGQASLWVLNTNARARRFYEAGGWQPDGTLKTATVGVTGSELDAPVEIVEVRYRRRIHQPTL
jgi:GNAT superfamily N-acetyltransferase